MNLGGTQVSPRQTPRWKLCVGVQSSETGGWAVMLAALQQGRVNPACPGPCVPSPCCRGGTSSELMRQRGPPELAVGSRETQPGAPAERGHGRCVQVGLPGGAF